MPKVKLYNTEGKVVGEKDLRADVFGVGVDPKIVHEVLLAMQANRRRPWAHTKDRGEVSGGGKKPWKQKGTGRARQGSIRSPIWVGGGITFGPRSERDYTQKINRKAKKRAFLMTLSDKAANDRIVLVEAFAAADGKTKGFAAMLEKLPVKGKKVAVVLAKRDAMLSRATRNLKAIRLAQTADVSMVDVLRSDYLLMTPEAAERLEKTYGSAKA